MAGSRDGGEGIGGAGAIGGVGRVGGSRPWRRPAAPLGMTALLALALQLIGAPLVGPDTPLGIVSLQFVADPARAAELVAGWGASGRVVALRHLLVDLLFPIAYASAIAAVAHLVGERGGARDRSRLHGPARGAARMGVAAAGLDLVENAAMLLTIGGRGGGWSTRLTVLMAVPKFALLGAAIATLVVLGARSLAVGLRPGRAG
ncbi:MAG: hypothetical protein RLZZ272_1599 [Actinomycetota bacterium]